jgi:inosose dehydratase
MTKPLSNRREFLSSAGVAAAAAVLYRGTTVPAAAPAEKLHVAINQWSIGAIRRRDPQNAALSFDDELAGLAAAGIDGLEPGLNSAAQVDGLVTQLAKHQLSLRSIYTGSSLVDPDGLAREQERIIGLAKRGKEAGAKVIVTNPNPLPNRQGKSDEQLKTQAAALNRLGHELAALGLILAYHNHDVELQYAAREFHHMMLGTDPQALALCLDAHWVYRGAGHSQVALFDVVQLYGARVAALHLRQSIDQVWSEAFGPGDIDYPALVQRLQQAGAKPVVVLEQGPEAATPQTLDVAEVHRRSARYAREVFAPLAS